MAETRICLHVRPEEEGVETLSVTSSSSRTGALREERKTETQKIEKTVTKVEELEANQTKTRETKTKEIPGPDSLNLLQGRKSNLGESHRLKQQQKQQQLQQAWRARPNLVLMMIGHSSTSPGNAIEFRRSTEDEEEEQPRPTQNL